MQLRNNKNQVGVLCCMSYAHSFEDIYFEYRRLNVTVNFSFIYEEWKLRNHIHLPSVPLVAPTPVTVRHAPRYGSVECCSVWDGSGILPTIFAVWWASQWLIWYFYGPPLSGRRAKSGQVVDYPRAPARVENIPGQAGEESWFVTCL